MTSLITYILSKVNQYIKWLKRMLLNILAYIHEPMYQLGGILVKILCVRKFRMLKCSEGLCTSHNTI